MPIVIALIGLGAAITPALAMAGAVPELDGGWPPIVFALVVAVFIYLRATRRT